MSEFTYRTVETRLFNQAVTFEVCGEINDKREIELTELFAVGEDDNGKVTLIPVHDMLNLPAIHNAVTSLLNEWTHSLIFNGSK